MKSLLKRLIRPLVLPLIHTWQWVRHLSRLKSREYLDYRRILAKKTVIATDIHGIRFVLYPFDRPRLSYLIRHPHDVAEFKIIPRLVQPGDTAFDVGANIGVYSVLLSRLCGPHGRVWAFEPAPDTYWRLRETLALNRCGNVTPAQKAVCEKDGTVQISLFEPQFAEWNSLGKPLMHESDGKPVSPVRSMDVPGQTLDAFCDTEGIKRIHFLKVDVEGFELSVFRGAERLLMERRVDYICFEISKEPLMRAGFDSHQVFAALESLGYRAYAFDMETNRFHGPIQDTSEFWRNFYASYIDLSKIDASQALTAVEANR